MYSSIQEILEKYKEKNKNEQTPISERHELVSKFSKKINEKRVADGFKPLASSYLNLKMADAGLKTNSDLYWFYAYCDETKNFDKTFWWSLKAKEPFPIKKIQLKFLK